MSTKAFLFLKDDSTKESLLDFLKKKVVLEKKIRFADDLLKNYLSNGFVRVDDSIQRNPNHQIKEGQTISIVIKIKDIKKTQKPPKVEFDFKFEDILYEDKAIIVVQKQPGVPTHATLDPDRDNLHAALKRFLLVRDGVVPYLALHHRLDKDTSGLILFAKKQSVNKSLSELFSQRKIEKTYLAATPTKKLSQDQWTIENHIARSSKDKKLMCSVKSGGDLAITEFKILKKNEKYLLLQAKPKTGRTHQIRVHLFEYGLPILGDVLYHNNGSENFPRLFLHAWKLKFEHPITKEKIEIESPIPKEFSDLF